MYLLILFYKGERYILPIATTLLQFSLILMILVLCSSLKVTSERDLYLNFCGRDMPDIYLYSMPNRINVPQKFANSVKGVLLHCIGANVGKSRWKVKLARCDEISI